jgi:predicted porin
MFGDLRMKKLLIAAAAMAVVAGAQAQSNVTLYGAYGNSVTTTETNGVNGNSAAQNASRDHLSTTALGIKGTEDLGGGMSAFFVLEGDLSGNGVLGAASTTSGTSETTNIFNRHAHAGLKTSFGTLSAGRQNDSVKDTEGLGQVYNLSDNLHNKTRIGDRIANAVKYATPTWNGLSATYTYSNNPADAALDASNSTTDHNSFAINYKLPVNGGVDLAYAQGEETTAGGVQSGKTTRLSARTNVMGVDVGAAYTTNQAAATAEKTKQTLVSVNKTIGKIDLKAHYVTNSADQNRGNSTDGFDGDGYGLMAVYNLSKRTAVYAGYADFSANNATDAATADVKITTLGLVHKF